MKNMKKLFAAMLATLISTMTPAAVLADDEEILDTVPEVEEEIAQPAAVSEPEPAPVVREESAAPAAKAEPAAPVAEEVQPEETVEEAKPVQEAKPAEKPAAKSGAMLGTNSEGAAAKAEAESLPMIVVGGFNVAIIADGALSDGDLITLYPEAPKGIGAYTATWEIEKGDEWVYVAESMDYTFTVSVEDGLKSWRVCLTETATGNLYISNVYILPEVAPAEAVLGAPEAAVEETVEQGDAVTVNPEADVRFGPDGMTPIISSVPEGAQVTILAIEGDWVKVEIDGQVGYVYKTDVKGIEEKTPEADPENPTGNMKVTIFTDRKAIMRPGQTITLTSRLEGFEGVENITFQWECDKGSGWEAIPGATSDSYSYAASSESLDWGWRLTVYFE